MMIMIIALNIQHFFDIFDKIRTLISFSTTFIYNFIQPFILFPNIIFQILNFLFLFILKQVFIVGLFKTFSPTA